MAESIKYMRGKTIKNITSLSKRRPKLKNATIIHRIGVHGKLLWLECSNEFIHLHMGLSGWIYTNRNAQISKLKYIKYIITMTDNAMIIVNDARKLSKLSICSKTKHHQTIKELGGDGICLFGSYTYERFANNAHNVNMNICRFLMDQFLNSGIGNYIKNEALYIARINPFNKTNDLTDEQLRRIYKAILFVSYSTVVELLTNNHMSIPKQIRANMPNTIQVPYKYKIYKKESPRIITTTIGGRTTYYDPDRQL